MVPIRRHGLGLVSGTSADYGMWYPLDDTGLDLYLGPLLTMVCGTCIWDPIRRHGLGLVSGTSTDYGMWYPLDDTGLDLYLGPLLTMVCGTH